MPYIAQYYDLASRSLGSSAVGLLEIPPAVSKTKEELFIAVAPLSWSCNAVPRRSGSLCLDACEVELKKVYDSSQLTLFIFFIHCMSSKCSIWPIVTLPSPPPPLNAGESGYRRWMPVIHL